MKNLPHFVPFLGRCAGGICALRQMCLVLRNSPDSQDVPLLVTMLSPLECLQSGTGKLSLSGMNAPEQPFTSYRRDLPQRLLKTLSIYLGEI